MKEQRDLGGANAPAVEGAGTATRYRTIVADPPWPIGDFPQWFASNKVGTVARPYDVLTVAEIKAMDVGKLADRHAHLYLWTITDWLEQSYGVARAWGFEPSAVLTWCKPEQPGGLGGTYPANLEFILFCTRRWNDERQAQVAKWLCAQLRARMHHRVVAAHFGVAESMVRHWIGKTGGRQTQTPSWDQWLKLKNLIGFSDEMDDLVAEINEEKGTLTSVGRASGRWFTWRRGRHSEKPEAFFDLVEQVSPGPYLELFARRQRLGWDTWGNEALEHVEIGVA